MRLVGMLTTHMFDTSCCVAVLATLGRAMIPLDISDVMDQYARINADKPAGVIGELEGNGLHVEEFVQPHTWRSAQSTGD